MYCIGSKIAHIHIIYLGHNICDGACIHVVYISNEDFMHYNDRFTGWLGPGIVLGLPQLLIAAAAVDRLKSRDASQP